MTEGTINTIVGFCQYIRKYGYNVGIQETIHSLEIAKSELIASKITYRNSLRSIMCSSKEEFELFNEIFDEYWENKSIVHKKPKQNPFPKKEIKKLPTKSLFGMGNKHTITNNEEGKIPTGASELERLKMLDFSKIPDSELPLIEILTQQLWQLLSLRLKRRLKKPTKNEQIDIRRTIRRNIGQGGEFIKLNFKGKKKIKPSLLILLDISGSMDQYSLFFLRFIFTLQENFKKIESFVFSTRLTRITKELSKIQLASSLQQISDHVDSWSSGTRIGECFQRFNSEYAKNTLSRKTIVLILSDGLDTGDPEMLKAEMLKIKRRSKKIIWLNPLKGMPNYQPLTRGISTILPLLDHFLSAHNINSFLKLENVIVNSFN
ncbi:MAG: VWA domain-containing protein [Candidatus Thorarchaeota archaeon]